jgi:hypothetical protein
VGTLARPTISGAVAGPSTVALSWSAVTPPGTGTVSYYVSRDGGAPAGDCPSSSSTSTVTTCTDSNLSLGVHHYTVTAVWRSWTATSTPTTTVEVTKLSQTITFTSTAPGAASVGGATYVVSATGGGSGKPVAFTIDAASSTVCSIAGKTVSFTAVGTCMIDANQAGNATYAAAPQAQQSFSVGKGSQTISFTSTAPGGASVGGSTYTVAATATSGLAVSFTIDAASSSVCSIAGKTVSFTAVGTCTIDANQAGNSNWNAAPQQQQSFSVAKGSQTITFEALAGKRFDQGPITVSATATSGLSVSFSSTTSGVCTVSGATVTFVTVGTCTIKADQTGDANWNAALSVSRSFTISKGNQTVSFTSTAPSSATVGGATYTPTATSTSGLTVALSIDASAGSVCSISGGVVSFKAAGTCVIDANQAGNSNWNAAPQVQQSFTVSAVLTITSVVKDGGKVKVHFTGTGAAASTTITVTICKINSFPCSAGNIEGISTATSPSAGAWTSAQDNNNLPEGITYFAQALQGAATSSVFTFSTTGL